MSLLDDIKLFEKELEKPKFRTFSPDSFTSSPLYTVDKAHNLVGKEFTFKGKQVVVTKADKNKQTIELAPVVRGKPVDDAAIVVKKSDFDKVIKHQYESEDTYEPRKKKCSCALWPYDCDDDCEDHRDFLLAPFYGRGDGKSAAEINTGGSGQRTGSGPAYPGAGGINMAGVPSGPNSGMGPMSSSAEISGNAIMEDMKLISQILR